MKQSALKLKVRVETNAEQSNQAVLHFHLCIFAAVFPMPLIYTCKHALLKYISKCCHKDGMGYSMVPHNICCGLFLGQEVKFIYINSTMNWTEAQSYCREHHTDLATVRNEAENKKIRQLVPQKQRIWFGLFRDSWQWVDGSPNSFSYWVENEPNRQKQSCAAAFFNNSGKWVDWSCTTRTRFICFDVHVVA
uniref:C-type lectin domain-containing protein n=1 Tax=Kryptolebias marmoratus TaxID=37003 RepID=A0A3Q3AM03_KRYMA